MDGFSVDIAELQSVEGKYRDIAATVRGDNVWKFDIDTERWPDGDPLRSAVETYQRSLKAARDRLCARTDRMATLLRETADTYASVDEKLVERMRSLGAGESS
ncbi:type VII secretion target [Lentzea sp. NBRC 102530]|uniref:type VII secretion target n=1 Tax=Lentzea sp. NBRC 102530 TaxID=3032201 RepID=UPI0024A43832|nr:type VII secretion target [Lentzea sp. NBRC 102530]GLY53385.1 hypothetical protein Lesp01_70410 [Lentzea sp. NBRC 102530]